MTTRAKSRQRPAITVTAEDHHMLSRIAEGAANTMPDLAAELSFELDRAKILPEGRVSGDHVRIGSEVTYRDEVTGKETAVTLVWPRDADISAGKISVVTPIGVALIGMAPGKSIEWTTRSGEVRRLSIVEVRDPLDARSEA
jgi:regulator of nucleoside diphosphate kinase